jgi:hypothetical protein
VGVRLVEGDEREGVFGAVDCFGLDSCSLRPCQLLEWIGKDWMRGGGPMLDNLESSCRLRFQKPGGASKRLVHCMLRCVVVVWDGKRDGSTDDDSRSDKLQKTLVVMDA